MAFIYNLTDSWNDVTTTWNGIKLAVTNTSSSASSKLLNLTVSGATTASFVVDKSGNLELNGSVNKVTITAPATAATFSLADGSTFATVGAHSVTFTATGTTALTLPTSGTVTALGNTSTGSGDIVLATSPTLVTPNLGTPSAATLTNATGLPVSTGISGFGVGVATALGINIGSAGAPVVNGGALGTPSSGTLTNCTGYSISNVSGLGSGVATWLATPSSSNLRAAVTDETGTGSLVFATSPTLVTPDLGTPSAATLTNATDLPISTGVSGLGTGVATFLATPSSANLASAVTDETGSGPLVFATSPTFTSDVTLGTQSTTQGSLVLANTASGSKAVTLKSSNSTSAAYTLTLPTTAGTNGYFLQTDGVGNLAWAAGGGGGGGSVAGADTQIQYNNAGSFGANAGFTFVNGATATMSIGIASTTSGVAKLYNSASANAITIASGNNSAAWTLTLPTSAGTNGYLLQTDGSGNTSWVTPPATGLTVGSTSIASGTSGRILYDNAGVLGEKTVTGTGDVVLATSPTLVTPNLGTPSAATLTNATGLPISTGVSGLGTNVATALATNVGSAGAIVVNGGALGTPSSGTLTNATGLPISTGVSGLGANVATFLATPSSANLASAVTDETGSGALVFGTSPTLTTPTINGNETYTGTAGRILADFDNATVNSRRAFQTSTTNASTGIYALPNGTSTAASWQAANNADPTNASKILIATNGSTDVQLVSGRNGTGTYLPLSFYTNNTQNAQLDTSGNFTTVGTTVMGSSFLRNRLINGGMRLDQRNAGASQTITAAAALAYTVDRWYAYCTGANVTGQQVANAGTTASPSQYAYQFTGAASVTAIGFGQRIEAVNSFDFAGQTTTLSVNLANSVLTTVTWTAYYANTADTFGTLASPSVTQIATGTFTVNSTLTRYTTNISIPAAATTGLQIVFTVGAQTSGTWTIGNVQLERGSVATPMERRQYGQELSLAQRYYQKLGGSVLADLILQGYATSGNGYATTIGIPAMRTAPTATQVGSFNNANVSSTTFYTSPTTLGWQVQPTATGYISSYSNNTTTYITLSSEL